MPPGLSGAGIGKGREWGIPNVQTVVTDKPLIICGEAGSVLGLGGVGSHGCRAGESKWGGMVAGRKGWVCGQSLPTTHGQMSGRFRSVCERMGNPNAGNMCRQSTGAGGR